MHENSASRVGTPLAHEIGERAIPVVTLVAVNLVATLGMLLLFDLLYPISRPPGWIISAILGFLFGEIAWLAFWFSLSGSTLRFRMGLVLAALVLYSLGHNFLIRYCAVLRLRWGTSFVDASFSWGDALGLFSREFNEGFCLVLLVYAVLLPIRHLSGIVVATSGPPEKAGRSRGQFQIQHWMIWAAIVAAPLAMTSMDDIRRADGGVPLLIVRLATLATSLLFALPVFLASLQQRRATTWTGMTMLGIVIAGISGSEVIRFSQPNFDWRTSLVFLGSCSIVICCNNILLRFLGLRLRWAAKEQTDVT